MNISLLCIGNELLAGKTLNTNASWIGKRLNGHGCSIGEHLVVPDKKTSIISGLDFLVSHDPDCIIITGGLGPTSDDITRPTIFEYVGTDSKFDSEYWEHLSKKFKQFGMDIPDSNRNQALVPEKGEIIDNPTGSARGLKFHLNERQILFVLPGVPSEMKAMVEASIIPWIRVNVNGSFYIKNLRTTGIPESALIEEISGPISSDHGCDIGYYPSILGVDIRLSSKDQTKLDELSSNICSILSDKIYCDGTDDIEDTIVHEAIKKKKTISIAESCTGGLLGHRITNVSGSSEVFKGSHVVYSNQAKIDLLGVNHRTIDAYGAVSREVAEEMANKVKNIFSTDYGLSVTGIAGPGGGTEEKPVGLVYIGLSDENKTEIRKYNFSSNRTNNKSKTSQVALDWLRHKLIND